MNLQASGTAAATAEFYCGERDLTVSQVDGTLLSDSGAIPKVLATRIAEVPYALHFVELGAAPLRALYALLGIAACVMHGAGIGVSCAVLCGTAASTFTTLMTPLWPRVVLALGGCFAALLVLGELARHVF